MDEEPDLGVRQLLPQEGGQYQQVIVLDPDGVVGILREAGDDVTVLRTTHAYMCASSVMMYVMSQHLTSTHHHVGRVIALPVIIP